MTLAPHSIALVLGTRPEIIKLAEIIKLLGPAVRVVHTGQHYDAKLADAFFSELSLGPPDVGLAVGGASRGRQIGEGVRLLDELFAESAPDAVVVQGDTNAVLAAALAANAQGIPLVHIEAGLRSFDRNMPEEHNRRLTDHISDLCCAPTEVNRTNLAAEGIESDRVVVTGNTVVEAVEALLPESNVRRRMVEELGLEPRRFVLSTFHRPENVDEGGNLRVILEQLGALPLPAVLPVHPRTARRIREFGLEDLLNKLVVIDPIGYGHFLGLAAESAFLVSDSGGVQEEVSVLKRPVMVVRQSTERPEALGTFAELVPPGTRIGEIAERWAADVEALHARLEEIPSPYGDGSASRRSVDALVDMLGRR